MSAVKPIIGVMPLWDDEKESIWMLPGYMDLIRDCGGLPIIFPLKASEEEIEQLCEMCSAFLLTGGHDVCPSRYSHPKYETCGVICDDRDSLEISVFKHALKHDKPVFGICRGIQLINAICGGTLYQDLPTEHSHKISVNHQMTPPYDDTCHSVKIIENTPLHKITEELTLNVNSYHHQAIKDLSPDFEIMATSEDGLIEAIYMPTKRFIMAVQWHPEFNFKKEPSSRKMIQAFVESCRFRGK